MATTFWNPTEGIQHYSDVETHRNNYEKKPTNYYKFLPLILALNISNTSTYFYQTHNHQLPANEKANPTPLLLLPQVQKPEEHHHQDVTVLPDVQPHYDPLPLFYPKPVEETGAFKTWYRWKEIDFVFPSEQHKIDALSNGDYIPENVLPLGIETFKDKVFISFPKWKKGTPYTLGVVPKYPAEESPKVIPYPHWSLHQKETCDSLTSVFRMQVDTCGRLWVLDSGQIEIATGPKQVCPPALFVFDLHTDHFIHRYDVPQEFIKEDGLFSNLIVDIRHDQCGDAYVYMTDVRRFGLIVYSLRENKSWRITDHRFLPDPLAAAFNIHGYEFEWADGLFSLALSPLDHETNDRTLYFHPMASYREFSVPASIIRNETGWEYGKDSFKIVGKSRGLNGHAAGAGMDKKGVLYYNLLSKDGIACWDSRKPYKRSAIGVIAENNQTMFFPNDIRLDKEERTSIWIITNRLPAYLYSSLDKNDYNFRVITAFADEAISGTVCDPLVVLPEDPLDQLDKEECY